MILGSRLSAIKELGYLALQALLITLLGFFLVRAIMTYVAPESVWIAANIQSEPSPTQAQLKIVKAEFSFDPFHRDKTLYVEDVVNTEPEIDAPETTLNLVLKGYRAADGEGSAVIRTPSNQEKNFAVGSEIVSGVVLKAVYPGYVVLSRNGVSERLTFKDKAKSGLLNEGRVTQPRVNSEQALGTNRIDMAGLSFADVMSQIQYSPEVVNGRMRGLRISRPGEALKSKGVLANDIVTHINGADLRRPSINIANVIAQQANRKAIVFRVIRNGKPQTIRVTL